MNQIGQDVSSRRSDADAPAVRLDHELLEAVSRPQSPPAMFEISSMLLRVSEIVAIIVTAILAGNLVIEYVSAELRQAYANAVVMGAIFYAGLGEVTGVYDIDVRFSVRRAWGRVLAAWFATAMFMITIGFLFKISEEFSRAWALLWFFAGGIMICVVRGAATTWLRRLKRKGVFNQRVAIFGTGPQGRRMAKYIKGNDKLTIDLMGFFDDRPESRIGTTELGLPVYGNLDGLVQAVKKGLIDQVIIALPWAAEERVKEVVAKLATTPIRIRLAPDLAGFAFAQRPMVMLGDLTVMTLFERPISGFDQLLKKLEDVILGVLITVALLPVFAIIALAIRLDSPGPIFFRQAREGFNDQKFNIWKFRSMRHDKAEYEAIRQATKGDARITRVGAFLRRTSLDELPQLFNVLAGEMSLVGPRPHASSTRAGDRLFREVVDSYAARHKVKPGMTGWAQACGWRGETDTEAKLVGRLEHDLYYVENWSILFDLYILLRTIPALVSSRAY
jgi:polysaccharide biosynthesis protein PslA